MLRPALAAPDSDIHPFQLLHLLRLPIPPPTSPPPPNLLDASRCRINSKQQRKEGRGGEGEEKKERKNFGKNSTRSKNFLLSIHFRFWTDDQRVYRLAEPERKRKRGRVEGKGSARFYDRRFRELVKQIIANTPPVQFYGQIRLTVER